MPKFSRLSPMAGVKRLVGVEALFQFGKGLAKIGAVGIVGGVVLWNDRDRLEVFARLDPAASLPAILSLSLRLLAGMLCMHLAITLGDALYARFRWRKRLRMSKEELKQEMKESEGNPEVKGRLKQLRMARVKKRMMAAVPTATVVVTNPTHYAVALRYEAGMGAPDLRRQGRRRPGAADPRSGRRARRRGDREPAPRPGAPRHRGDRPRNSAPSTTGRWPRSSASCCACASGRRRGRERQPGP